MESPIEIPRSVSSLNTKTTPFAKGISRLHKDLFSGDGGYTWKEKKEAIGRKYFQGMNERLLQDLKQQNVEK